MTLPTPRTEALKVYIDRSIARLLTQRSADGNADAPGDGVLFVGNWHDSFPRALLMDPALTDTDVFAWLHMKAQADPNAAYTFSQDALAKAIKKSKPTLIAALHILQLTRWLTLCARLRDPTSNQYRGNVYALHDQPLPLADTQHLNPDYLDFVREMTTHANPRVRQVANDVLKALADDIEAGSNPTAPRSVIEQAAATVADTNPEVHSHLSEARTGRSRLFATARWPKRLVEAAKKTPVKNLKPASDHESGVEPRIKNFNAAPTPQIDLDKPSKESLLGPKAKLKIFPSCSSSINPRNTTTTTFPEELETSPARTREDVPNRLLSEARTEDPLLELARRAVSEARGLVAQERTLALTHLAFFSHTTPPTDVFHAVLFEWLSVVEQGTAQDPLRLLQTFIANPRAVNRTSRGFATQHGFCDSPPSLPPAHRTPPAARAELQRWDAWPSWRERLESLIDSVPYLRFITPLHAGIDADQRVVLLAPNEVVRNGAKHVLSQLPAEYPACLRTPLICIGSLSEARTTPHASAAG